MRNQWSTYVVVGLLIGALSGCDRSCNKLAERLCLQADEAHDKDAAAQCEAWKDRTSRVTPATCQAALQLLDQRR